MHVAFAVFTGYVDICMNPKALLESFARSNRAQTGEGLKDSLSSGYENLSTFMFPLRLPGVYIRYDDLASRCKTAQAILHCETWNLSSYMALSVIISCTILS